MLVSVSPGQKQVTMLSLPRDTVDIPLANGQIWSGKVNGIANSYGLDGLRHALATMWDIKIPYYVKVNMDDFVALVDAVGGISVKVETVVQEPRWGLYLTPGKRAPRWDHRAALLAGPLLRQRLCACGAPAAGHPRAGQQIYRSRDRHRTGRPARAPWRAGDQLADAATSDPDRAGAARRPGRLRHEVLTPPAFALGWGDQGDGRGWVIIPNVEAMRAEIQTLFAD